MNKSRRINHIGTQYGRQYLGYNNQTIATTTFSYPGWEITSSDNHPGWRKRAEQGGDVGGFFYNKKTLYEDITGFSGTVFSDAKYYGAPMYNYMGPIYPGDRPLYSSMPQGPSTAEILAMYAKGTEAISKVIPTNPVASATVFIGELREGLPHIVGKELFKSKLKDVRKAGSEYLNIEFGIKPMISDFKQFGNAVVNHKKIIDQLHADSGKLIRRSYTFPTITTETEVVTANTLPFPPLNAYYYNGGTSGGWTKTETTVKEVTYKFSGAFTYHLNLGDDTLSKMQLEAQEARKLLGIGIPTISDIYNLAPWSWALDWFTNTGQIMHNVSQFAEDGLVMPYGYIQRHEVSKTTRRIVGPGYQNGGRNEFVDMYGYESKCRLAATPFGFGLNTSDFTDRQWSIAAALGLTKAPKKLK